jgi:hypothetical protein
MDLDKIVRLVAALGSALCLSLVGPSGRAEGAWGPRSSAA